MVHREADLSAVDVASSSDQSCGVRQVMGAVDDSRAFAPELQRQRGEVFGRSAHHELAYRRASGEEDVVDRLVEKDIGHVITAVERGHQPFVKHLADDLTYHLSSRWGQTVRLDHDRVAGRHRGNEWLDRKMERKVPWAKYQADPSCLILHRWLGPRQPGGRLPPLGPHPIVEILQSLVDGAAGPRHLTWLLRRRWLGQVCYHCGLYVGATREQL